VHLAVSTLRPTPLVRAVLIVALAIAAALLAPVSFAGAEEAATAPLFETPKCAVDFDANSSRALPLAPPDVVYTGTCSVSRNCNDGSSIRCKGFSTCSSGPGSGGGYVDCDGNVTWCPYDPNCNAGDPCTSPQQCQCYGYICACVNDMCVCAF